MFYTNLLFCYLPVCADCLLSVHLFKCYLFMCLCWTVCQAVCLRLKAIVLLCHGSSFSSPVHQSARCCGESLIRFCCASFVSCCIFIKPALVICLRDGNLLTAISINYSESTNVLIKWIKAFLTVLNSVQIFSSIFWKRKWYFEISTFRQWNPKLQN